MPLRVLLSAVLAAIIATAAAAQTPTPGTQGATTAANFSSVSGDCTATEAGVFTCPTNSGEAFGPFYAGTDAANLTGVVPGSVLQVTDTTKTGNYPVVAGDMGQALDLKGTGHTLTLSAKASNLWQPGHTLSINNTSSGNWTITNSSTLTLAGLNSTTLPPGASGTFVANANGTHLDFFPGVQPPTTTAIGGVNAKACSAGQFVNDISTAGAVTCAAPSGGSAKQIFTFFTGAGTLATTGTTFFGVGSVSSTETTSAQFPMSIAGTFKNLRCLGGGAALASGSWAISLRANEASPGSAPTVTIDSGGRMSALDSTNTYAASAGDRINLQAVSSTPSAAKAMACTMEFDPS